MPDPSTFPLPALVGLLAAAAAVVWVAGVRLAAYADVIARRTGLGQAVVGVLLLGGVTSLPEVATTLVASADGIAPLAVNNVLGGVAFQVALLALADALVGRDALTSVIAEPVVLLQGMFAVLLLSLVTAGITVGEAEVLGVGAWSLALVPVYLWAIALIGRAARRRPWIAAGLEERERQLPAAEAGPVGGPAAPARLARRTALAAVAIFAAGFVITRTAGSIADRTGLGASFVGAVLVALTTSLPEVSTVIAAVRLRRYEMAFSDIFGTNLFDLILITLADAVYAGPPVLEEVGRFSAVAALLGIALTTVYLVGLIERRDRVVFRLGVDSLVVLVLYGGGLVLLYALR